MLGVDQVAAVLQQNLQEMWGLSPSQVPVHCGAHLVKVITQPQRIVVGLRPRFVGGPAIGDHAPGPAPLGDGTVARVLNTRAQEISVWVRGPAAPQSVAAGEVVLWEQAACAELMHRVWAALWVAGAGGEQREGAIVVQGGEWLTLESADLRSGAEVRIDCLLRLPVLDVAVPALQLDINNATTAVYACSPDGSTEELVSLVGPPLPP